MGGKSQPSGTTTSVQNTEPWGPQQPYLEGIFSRAQGLYDNNTPQYYPGTTYAGPTGAQNSALAGIQNVTGPDGVSNPITNTAGSTATNLLNGNFLYGNPALSAFETFASTPNIGANNLGTNALLGQAGGVSNPAQGYLDFFSGNNPASNAPGVRGLLQAGATDPGGLPGNSALSAIMGGSNGNAGTDALAQFMRSNPGYGLPGSGVLGSLSLENQGVGAPGNGVLNAISRENQGVGAPGGDVLSRLSAGNPLFGNPGAGLLSNLAQRNIGSGAPGSDALASLSANNAGWNAGTDRLNSLSQSNFGAGSPGSDVLRSLSLENQGVGAPGSNILSGLASSDLAGSNPANGAFGFFASGANQASANPNTSELAKSVLSQVVPSIQSQFINGGALNSPEAARATAAGATSALAPFMFQQYQQEQANTLAGAQGLSNSYLQGQGLRGSLAQNLAGNALQGAGLQGSAAQNLVGDYLQGGALQGSLAQNVAGNLLQGSGLQNAASQNLASNYLTGGALQGTLAQNLTNAGLQGTGLQGQFAQNLSSNALQGAGLQNQAAQNLAGNALQGAGLQNQAAQALAGYGLQGAGLQGQFANNLASQLFAGQGQQSSAAQGLNSGYLQGQGLQQQANSNLLNAILSGNQQQIGAASQLGSQGLQGAGLQQSAASNLGSQALQGQGLQQQAATGEGNVWGQGVQNMLQALGLAPQTQAMPYTDLAQLYSAGATQQGLSQQAINDAVQRYNYGQTLPFNALNQYIGQVTGNYGGTTQLNQPFFAPSGAQQALSGLSQVGGALGGIASIIPFLPSDRRLKADIKRVGTLDNGLPVYAYRYRGDTITHIGLMADEVEHVHPEAVITTPSGYKAVRYDLAVI